MAETQAPPGAAPPGRPQPKGKAGREKLIVGAVILLIVGWVLYKRHQANSSSASTSTTPAGIDPNTGIPYAEEYGGMGLAGWGGTSAGPGPGTPTGGVVTVPTPTGGGGTSPSIGADQLAILSAMNPGLVPTGTPNAPYGGSDSAPYGVVQGKVVAPQTMTGLAGQTLQVYQPAGAPPIVAGSPEWYAAQGLAPPTPATFSYGGKTYPTNTLHVTYP